MSEADEMYKEIVEQGKRIAELEGALARELENGPKLYLDGVGQGRAEERERCLEEIKITRNLARGRQATMEEFSDMELMIIEVTLDEAENRIRNLSNPPDG